MNKTIFVLCALCAALTTACGGPSAEAKRAERARLAEARGRLEGLESKLQDSADPLETLRSIIAIEAMELDDPKAAVDRFEANADLLGRDRMARIYLAVAQCKTAGVSKKIEHKLAWLRQGMTSFDALREDYPDDETVYLYQASTYAFFPIEVGAKADVLDLLSDMLDRYRDGQWTLSPGAAIQLASVFSSLGETYRDAESSAEIENLEADFRSGLPAFARAVDTEARGE